MNLNNIIDPAARCFRAFFAHYRGESGWRATFFVYPEILIENRKFCTGHTGNPPRGFCHLSACLGMREYLASEKWGSALRYRAFLTPATRKQLPEKSVGQGQLLATGFDPMRVQYTLIRKARKGDDCYFGVVKGSPDRLIKMWASPAVVLRMSDGRRIVLSITEINGNIASFEVVEREDLRRYCAALQHDSVDLLAVKSRNC